MYKNPAATRVTAENCPPRIILDEASTSIPEVMEKVSNGFFTQAIIAYIWRQPEEKRNQIKESVIRDVFEPLAACLPFWEKGKWSENNPTFILSDVFDLASGRGIPGARDVTCQYRVGSFVDSHFRALKEPIHGETWILRVHKKGVGLGRFKETALQDDFGMIGQSNSFNENFREGPLPHIDGNIRKIYRNQEKRLSRNIRALTVYQRGGTFFWAETPADLGVKSPFSDEIFINRRYLKGREIFQAAAGDVIFFENGPRSWSECFIHQAAMAKPLDVNSFDLGKARLLSTYDMTLAI